jgi:hypothetical protein
MIHTPQCLASYHTINIGSSNLCTSWYCQDELSMLNHELLGVCSTSIVTVALFTIARLRYLISLCNSGCILLGKVALQYFLCLKASAMTLALLG